MCYHFIRLVFLPPPPNDLHQLLSIFNLKAPFFLPQLCSLPVLSPFSYPVSSKLFLSFSSWRGGLFATLLSSKEKRIAEKAQALELDWYECECQHYQRKVTSFLCASVSDVSEPDHTGWRTNCDHLFFPNPLHWLHAGSLKSAIIGIFTPQKSANTTNENFYPSF